jgi:hypothetical protein
MHPLVWFGLQLVLVAWLRKCVVLKRGAHSPPQWRLELGFGLLFALPLLPAVFTTSH